MALPRAQPGEVIDVRPLGPALGGTRTATLVKTPTLEVIRLIIPADQETCHHHEMAGEIMVHCLEGLITVQINGDSRVLEAGQMLYLSGGQPHSLSGIEDASVLLTMLLG
ncbi:MAG: cupin domain-containing protein [Isosphaeraceae bacterium]|jgi:quercetin dioxygenase-like cupin family protein